jgi:hypothetical protein
MGGIGFWLVAGSQMRSIFKSGLQIQAAHIGIAECQILLSRFTVTLVVVQTVNAISFFMLFLPISPNLRDLQVPIMIFHFIAKVVVVLGLYISYVGAD